MAKNKIKVLHIGNIANNAYKNSVILRKEGILCDVLCYDYFHVMGTPEWEEAEFKGDYGDDFSPNLTKVDLGGYERPGWFKQGFLEDIYKDIKITNQVRPDLSISYERLFLKLLLFPFAFIYNQLLNFEKFLIKQNFGVLSKLFHRYPYFTRLVNTPRLKLKYFWNTYLVWADEQLSKSNYNRARYINTFDLAHFEALIEEFKKYFPERKDQLTLKDIFPYYYRTQLFRQVFKNYDLIHCYATDPIWPMLANFRPYIAYEHGTIRDIPYWDSAIGRLTALAYRKADLVMITNCDAISSAKKLGIKKYIGIPHPINTKWIDHKMKKEKNEILLFCPLRHDYAIKGTDKYIRALKIIKEQTSKSLKMILIEWGLEIEKSKKLINRLGLEENVLWQKSMPSKTLTGWMVKSDIICDQIALPHFGATAPLGMAASKPVLMSYQPESTRWAFPEDTPIIPVFNEKDIAKEIISLIKNPKKRTIIGKKGLVWFNKYHSDEVIGKTLINSYKILLKEKNESKRKIKKTQGSLRQSSPKRFKSNSSRLLVKRT